MRHIIGTSWDVKIMFLQESSLLATHSTWLLGTGQLGAGAAELKVFCLIWPSMHASKLLESSVLLMKQEALQAVTAMLVVI